MLDHTHTPYSTLQLFVQPYATPRSQDETTAEVVDLENPPPSDGAQLPCPAAVEFLADIHEAEGGDSLLKAIEVRGKTHMCLAYADKSCSFGIHWQITTTRFGKSM